MLIYDLETLRILKINNAFSEKYKYSQEEIEREAISIKQIRPKEDIPKLLQNIEKVNGSGIADSGFHRHRSKDGEIFYMKITSQPFSFEGADSRLVVLNDITAQVEAEKKSTKALQDLQHLIENSPFASVKVDRNLNIIEWCGEVEDLSGLRREKVHQKKLFSLDLLSDSQQKLIKNNLKPLVSGKEDRNQFEMKVCDIDDRRFHLRIHASALRDDAGRLQSILALIEDVTEQKRSDIKYQGLFEHANDCILIIKDGKIVDCNSQGEKLYKLRRDKIIGKHPGYFSPQRQPDGTVSNAKIEKNIQITLQEGASIFEWMHRDSEGTLVNVEAYMYKFKFPDGEYVKVNMRDITEKKETRAKLRKNEELFQNLFIKSPAALVMVDRQDKIEMVNDSFEKMFGYDLGDILGKDIDKLIVPPGELENAPQMKKYSLVGHDFQIEGIRLSKSGEKKDVIIAGMPIKIDGEPVAGLGMYLDITDRKNSEKQLKKSLDEKQVLLEEVHHRVKNNLAIISGLLELETMNWDKDTAVKSVMQQSQLRVHSMSMIHEKLYQAGDFSNIKLENYISELVSVIYDTLRYGEKETSVDLDVKSEDIQLNINQAIPCALLINELVTNALKHAFKDQKNAKLIIDLKERFGTITVKVEDNGCGLPADFENITGNSLGHLLIKKLVKQLQGKVEAFSSPGSGTRYEIKFEKKQKSGSSCRGKLNGQHQK